MKVSMKYLMILATVSVSASFVQAHTVELSRGETCVVSPDLSLGGGEEYTNDDREDVQDLCSYDPHIKPDDNGQSESVGLCHKLNSTFPAVEFVEIPKGMSKAERESQCNRRIGEKNGGKLAKYKYSMSCANTSSIIGYYHVARALGIKFVPPSVLRTMDREFHQQFASQGASIVGGDKQLISQNWRRLKSLLGKKDKNITTSSGEMSFGALALNPKGEQKTYDGIYLGGDGQGARLKNFMTSSKSTYRLLKNDAPIKSIVGNEFTSANYTRLQQMKDVADMIVLDTIFAQKDRFANTHSRYTWLVIDNLGVLRKRTLKQIRKMMEKDIEDGVAGAVEEYTTLEKYRDMKKDWRKEITKRLAKIRPHVESYLDSKGYRYAFAENLVLKDNDCGLKDSNPFMKAKVINGLRHISPETYEQLMKLYQKVIVEGSMDEWLTKNLAMNAADMKKFKTGLKYAAETLKANKDNNKLKTDLVVKAHFIVKPPELHLGQFPVFPITDGDYNVRQANHDVMKVLPDEALNPGREPLELSHTSIIQSNGAKLQSEQLGKVAVLERLTVGGYKFVKAVVLEADDESLIDSTVYFSAKAIQ